MRAIAFTCLLAAGLCVPAHSQGTIEFAITIRGSEIVNGTEIPVVGTGSLQLFAYNMNYDVFVPVGRVLPREAHFHGPLTDGAFPIISLAPYTTEGTTGIRYRGNQNFEPKYIPDIMAGNWYIQLHATGYANGVINGFILPIPEARTITLFLVGLGIVALGQTRLSGRRNAGIHRSR